MIRRPMMRKLTSITSIIFLILIGSYFFYFPGQQCIIAFTLATGLNMHSLQDRLDSLQEKAKLKSQFTEEDKIFLEDLYTCFAKGGKLTILLRQSGQLMEHYLSSEGTPLQLNKRIFIRSSKVKDRMQSLKKIIIRTIQEGKTLAPKYSSPVFNMQDKDFPDSLMGLYFGIITVSPKLQDATTILFKWRAEVPWYWPSYHKPSPYQKDAFTPFPIPSLLSAIQGGKHALRIEDGLAEYLVELDLAKPFLAYSEWEEKMIDEIDIRCGQNNPANNSARPRIYLE